MKGTCIILKYLKSSLDTVYFAVLMQEWFAMENSVYTATHGT